MCEPPGVGFHIEAGLGFDPVAQETVLLSDAEWVLALDDTALFETYGVGCPAADEPRMQSTMRPILGATMDLDAVWSRVRASLLMIGSSRYKLGAVDLPIDLSGLGVDGCWLQTSAELNVPPTSVSTNNHARYRLAIPNDLALRGKCVYAQALVLGLSSFGFTDGAVLRMGVR